MRHAYASILIAQGLDVVYVSRQPWARVASITLTVYAGLFDRQRHAERAKAAVEARFGGLLVEGEAEGGELVALPVP
jgi:hypothetical protein